MQVGRGPRKVQKPKGLGGGGGGGGGGGTVASTALQRCSAAGPMQHLSSLSDSLDVREGREGAGMSGL